MVYLFNYLSSFSPSRVFSNRDTVARVASGSIPQDTPCGKLYLCCAYRDATRTRPNKATLEADTPRTGSKEEDRDETLNKERASGL